MLTTIPPTLHSPGGRHTPAPGSPQHTLAAAASASLPRRPAAGGSAPPPAPPAATRRPQRASATPSPGSTGPTAPGRRPRRLAALRPFAPRRGPPTPPPSPPAGNAGHAASSTQLAKALLHRALGEATSHDDKGTRDPPACTRRGAVTSRAAWPSRAYEPTQAATGGRCVGEWPGRQIRLWSGKAVGSPRRPSPRRGDRAPADDKGLGLERCSGRGGRRELGRAPPLAALAPRPKTAGGDEGPSGAWRQDREGPRPPKRHGPPATTGPDPTAHQTNRLGHSGSPPPRQGPGPPGHWTLPSARRLLPPTRAFRREKGAREGKRGCEDTVGARRPASGQERRGRGGAGPPRAPVGPRRQLPRSQAPRPAAARRLRRPPLRTAACLPACLPAWRGAPRGPPRAPVLAPRRVPARRAATRPARPAVRMAERSKALRSGTFSPSQRLFPRQRAAPAAAAFPASLPPPCLPTPTLAHPPPSTATAPPRPAPPPAAPKHAAPRRVASPPRFAGAPTSARGTAYSPWQPRFHGRPRQLSRQAGTPSSAPAPPARLRSPATARRPSPRLARQGGAACPRPFSAVRSWPGRTCLPPARDACHPAFLLASAHRPSLHESVPARVLRWGGSGSPACPSSPPPGARPAPPTSAPRRPFPWEAAAPAGAKPALARSLPLSRQSPSQGPLCQRAPAHHHLPVRAGPRERGRPERRSQAHTPLGPWA
ncbi:PREDICTED: basic proline-rich protein-like [Capra hircus]|uniref:basic proline-rich protein-like n=1 Tax=Capra hircus TaxID=9925 RepID=UPI0008479A46|nr:PREDICTED: basic proline-rich protein-like [Capra hircus]